MRRKKRSSNRYLLNTWIAATVAMAIAALTVFITGDTKYEVGKCYEGEIAFYKVTEIRKTQFEVNDKVVNGVVVLMTGVSKPEYGDLYYSENFESPFETTEKSVVGCSLFHGAMADYHLKMAMKKIDEMQDILHENR
jgi:hypothetical protein